MCYVVGLSSLGKVKRFLRFFFGLSRGKGAVFFAIPEKEVLDFIAHSLIIRVFTVTKLG